MARGDFKVKNQTGSDFSLKRNVPSGTAVSINAGEPTKSVDAAAASPYLGTVAICVDGDGSTAQRFTGVSKDDSTDTAAAAGYVNTIMPLPGIIYSGKAKSTTAVDTVAEVEALIGKRVVFDLTGTAWTIDTAAADAVANCVVIIGGDYRTFDVFWTYSPHGTFLDFAISA
ncbi:MAG: hypothetical protein V4438_04210 [Patescibacteria group bacterium]